MSAFHTPYVLLGLVLLLTVMSAYESAASWLAIRTLGDSGFRGAYMSPMSLSLAFIAFACDVSQGPDVGRCVELALAGKIGRSSGAMSSAALLMHSAF